jgi:tetratricopeptide (TPR) repeat protein
MRQKFANFIDKTFTILSDLLLKFLPATKKEKQAFAYYRAGLSAQTMGNYAKALDNFYEALKLEEDPSDRGHIYYNIALIYTKNGELIKAIEYYSMALDNNPILTQAFNNLAVINHVYAVKAGERKDFESAQSIFKSAAAFWRRAIRMAPGSYPEAQNWLKITGGKYFRGYRGTTTSPPLDDTNNFYIISKNIKRRILELDIYTENIPDENDKTI